MVLPLIVCLLKPSSPICKDNVVTTPTPLEIEDELSQEELLQYGGIGFLLFLLTSLLIWALSKLVNARMRSQRAFQQEQAQEMKDIRRSLRDEGGRKLI